MLATNERVFAHVLLMNIKEKKDLRNYKIYKKKVLLGTLAINYKRS